ncbi:hypothetical protein Glove_535g25 [Diversispora epigaea]|uniref:BTB domain-containing protein n=1 Tax=Diversispora epigaea TaxID=1348612 RepID=A0A397GDB5_9GLOM|nr:hypothetical protein Glove_535g25 [Diversispora epigaea]
MSKDFFDSLSRDFHQLLDESDDYNVIIRVGEADDEKTFNAHSVILRARSPYFRTALASQWARKEGDYTVFSKPNVSPIVFDLILKYMYSGSINLSRQNNSDVLELLIASDELLLSELFEHIQEYLLNSKSEWIKRNVIKVHRTIYPHDGCKKLQDYCLDIICKNPLLLFESKDFHEFDESLLLPLLSRDDLQIDEIEIWDHLIQWGLAQMSDMNNSSSSLSTSVSSSTSNTTTSSSSSSLSSSSLSSSSLSSSSLSSSPLSSSPLSSSPSSSSSSSLSSSSSSSSDGDSSSPNLVVETNKTSNWTDQEFLELEKILHNCIPLIRFISITSSDFYDKVWPYHKIISDDLREELLHFHLKKNIVIPSPTTLSKSSLLNSSSLTTSNPPSPPSPSTSTTSTTSTITASNQNSNASNPSSPTDSLYYYSNNSSRIPRFLLPPRVIPFDSTLLKTDHIARLCDWIDRKDGKPYTFEEIPYKFKLLVRGSRDGFESETFHDKCDKQGATIVIMQIAYSGELIGGYNPIEWNTGDYKITTQNSFLFSFPKVTSLGNNSNGNNNSILDFKLFKNSSSSNSNNLHHHNSSNSNNSSNSSGYYDNGINHQNHHSHQNHNHHNHNHHQNLHNHPNNHHSNNNHNHNNNNNNNNGDYKLNLSDAKLSRVNRPGYAIRIKDKSYGPCFGDKDLWMKNNFKDYDSCSSDKDDYSERITSLSKFWVMEYEVFKVIRK